MIINLLFPLINTRPIAEHQSNSQVRSQIKENLDSLSLNLYFLYKYVKKLHNELINLLAFKSFPFVRKTYKLIMPNLS